MKFAFFRAFLNFFKKNKIKFFQWAKVFSLLSALFFASFSLFGCSQLSGLGGIGNSADSSDSSDLSDLNHTEDETNQDGVNSLNDGAGSYGRIPGVPSLGDGQNPASPPMPVSLPPEGAAEGDGSVAVAPNYQPTDGGLVEDPEGNPKEPKCPGCPVPPNKEEKEGQPAVQNNPGQTQQVFDNARRIDGSRTLHPAVSAALLNEIFLDIPAQVPQGIGTH